MGQIRRMVDLYEKKFSNSTAIEILDLWVGTYDFVYFDTRQRQHKLTDNRINKSTNILRQLYCNCQCD